MGICRVISFPFLLISSFPSLAALISSPIFLLPSHLFNYPPTSLYLPPTMTSALPHISPLSSLSLWKVWLDCVVPAGLDWATLGQVMQQETGQGFQGALYFCQYSIPCNIVSSWQFTCHHLLSFPLTTQACLLSALRFPDILFIYLLNLCPIFLHRGHPQRAPPQRTPRGEINLLSFLSSQQSY